MVDFSGLKEIGVTAATESVLKKIAGQQSAILDRLLSSLEPLFDPEPLRGLNRALLLADACRLVSGCLVCPHEQEDHDGLRTDGEVDVVLRWWPGRQQRSEEALFVGAYAATFL